MATLWLGGTIPLSENDPTKVGTYSTYLQTVVEACLRKVMSKNLGGATSAVTLTSDTSSSEAWAGMFVFSNAGAAIDVKFPQAKTAGVFIVKNSAGFTLTIKTDAGGSTGIAVADGETRFLWINGNNVEAAAPEATSTGGGLRILAAPSLTIFVNSSSGDDGNDGLTSGTALETIQAAINLIKASYDLGGPRAAPIVIQLADGTYDGGSNPVAMVSGPFVGQQQTTYTFPSTNEVPVSIRGNSSTPSNVVLTSSGGLGTVLTVWQGVIGVQDCKITNTGAGACLEAGGAAGIQFGNVVLGACGGAKIQSEHGSIIESYSNFTVEGNCTNVLRSVHHSSLWLSSTMALGNSFTVTHFAIVRQSSEISVPGFSISPGGNTVTGTRFAIVDSSSINGTGSDVNFFPGTVAGTVDNGSYDGMRSILGTVAWPTYTPTVTAFSGSITTVGALDAAYWIDGKTVHFRISVTITTNGTGAGYVVATLPVTAKAKHFEYMARRVDSGNFIGATILSSDSTHIYFATLTNTYPGADGAVLVATGTYEAA